MEKSFRSLENYKRQHQETARKRGNLEDFNEAKTLTEARKLAFGEKKKHRKAKK